MISFDRSMIAKKRISFPIDYVFNGHLKASYDVIFVMFYY